MKDHLALEDLALLAEGRPIADSNDADRHLATCRSCAAAYVDAVRYRAAWLAMPGAFDPPTAEVRAGMALIEADAAEATASRIVRPHPARVDVRWAAGVATVVVALVFWALTRAPADDLPAPIVQALAQHAEQGLLLPGVHGSVSSPTIRSGAAEAPIGLGDAVASALADFETRGPSAHRAYVAGAGCLARGNPDAARDFAREGERLDARDTRCTLLLAALDYRENRLADAESRLRAVVAREPANRTAVVDLGMVLRAAGREHQAREWLEPLARGNDAAGLRARVLLTSPSSAP